MDRRAWQAIIHGVAKETERCLQSQGLNNLRPSRETGAEVRGKAEAIVTHENSGGQEPKSE